MLTIDKINELIGVTESFHASYKLMEILQDKSRTEKLFDSFLMLENDLTFDWFTDYFQSEHSDRKGKKQDFTPDGIVTLASSILGDFKTNVDICSGTGGLTIKRYSVNPQARFYCEEFSDRALPFLLFNLAIRNVDAIVRHGDSLTRKFKAIYHLTKSDRFSNINKTDEGITFSADTVIMNPPYSLPWKPEKDWINQDRFKPFEKLAPNSKSDYAFLLQGLSQLNDGGTMTIILPHGVLFRGSAEEMIRTNLIKKNLLDAVIGLPEKAFYNTDIPTVIMVLKKNRANKNILFIDASQQFTKCAKHNVIEQQHIDKILQTLANRKNVDKLSYLATYEDLVENDFNLNIPRYVDTFEPEKTISLDVLTNNLKSLDQQIDQAERDLGVMVNELVSTNSDSEHELNCLKQYFNEKYGIIPKIKKANKIKREQLSLL